MKDRRLGRFLIPTSLMERDPDIVRAVMGRCVILRAEHLYYGEQIDYVATSPDFDELEEGLMIPEYDVIIHDPSGMIEFKKQN